jgi:hypothetical protein
LYWSDKYSDAGGTSAVNDKIEEHTFAVPLYGVKLDGDAPFQLGSAIIFKMAPEGLDELGIEHAHSDVAKLLKKSPTDVCLKSTVRSTQRVAERKFAKLAATTTGVLAIAAASMYQPDWRCDGIRCRGRRLHMVFLD